MNNYGVILDARRITELQALRLIINQNMALASNLSYILVSDKFMKWYKKYIKNNSIIDHGEIWDVSYKGIPLITAKDLK